MSFLCEALGVTYCHLPSRENVHSSSLRVGENEYEILTNLNNKWIDLEMPVKYYYMRCQEFVGVNRNTPRD